ncbi:MULTISPECIES: TspO/MBR family protein [Gammaproteobacteria]|uniref:TspO/MBR family protein n=1 Tax=Gammaproteobacteria TaxID=1236 RepID=UPI000DD05837|nr:MULTISPECIES: TspO/MBR family protein [Gammaproteobacteria]RTE85834.1 tryptophan-rich sensory protein [Aliidiomarina sp. B3213]TCZ90165.1 tryptophan-rich sensory protein [Lysobacter sp. N42]
MKQFLGLLVCLMAVYLTATIGAAGSIQASSFYVDLNQPSWAPPAWLFGPVWTTLYTFMGVSVWLIWRLNPENSKRLLLFFAAHLVVNALWSWFFFAWQMGLVSFLWILLLIAMVVKLIVDYWKVSKPAALLLVPYLAWISFAAVLNFAIWQLNTATL